MNKPKSAGAAEPKCAPLCGASKAYGPRDKWWLHEPNCPVRISHLKGSNRDR